MKERLAFFTLHPSDDDVPMVIKFVCACGKHLRARDEMAARRSMCPACGAPVGVPSLHPTIRGAPAGPLSREEIRARSRVRAEPADPSPDLSAVALVTAASGVTADAPGAAGVPFPPDQPQRFRFPGRFPRHFASSILFGPLPLRLAILTAALTALGGWASVIWTNQSPDRTNAAVPLFLTVIGMVALPVLGSSASLCEFMLLWGSGDVRRACWPGRDLSAALRSALRWVYCFLAGPLIPAVAAPCYWLYTGDPVFLDWLVLAELVALAVGYWLLAVVLVTHSGRLRDANPIAVARLAHHMGFRTALAVLAATLLAVGLGWLALRAVPTFHDDLLLGLLLLAGFWAGTLTAGTALFALLGFWSRPRKKGLGRKG